MSRRWSRPLRRARLACRSVEGEPKPPGFVELAPVPVPEPVPPRPPLPLVPVPVPVLPKPLPNPEPRPPPVPVPPRPVLRPPVPVPDEETETPSSGPTWLDAESANPIRRRAQENIVQQRRDLARVAVAKRIDLEVVRFGIGLVQPRDPCSGALEEFRLSG